MLEITLFLSSPVYWGVLAIVFGVLAIAMTLRLRAGGLVPQFAEAHAGLRLRS